ncbi:hypothetical protein VIBNISOn1_1740005 [Vibrio nigripulchritudo SOn1]|uniref:Uncharacterized protein n=1 Tax=Vibrio nigripulchritudo SOn1 TaxID=1238450 RepID=A0AAV2VP73_9VIBR|nr:hypothetical protein [Vibrio nigripulchritudo]CCO46328.1 hypothetical protein VIBNISOn1_1740005 [Vibrio nigripulchritudo SOn1]
MNEEQVEKSKQDCILKMVEVLSTFQQIERSLKDDINLKYDLIRQYLDGRAPFHHKIEKSLPLGGLVEHLERLLDDKDLIASLRRMAKYRNEIAHEKFLIVSESQDIEEINRTHKWLNGLHNELGTWFVSHSADRIETMHKSVKCHFDQNKST